MANTAAPQFAGSVAKDHMDESPKQSPGLTLLRLAPAMLAAYWLAMFVGAHIPLRVGDGDGYTDKLDHLAAFAGLIVLFLTAWSLQRSLRLPQYAQAVAVLTLYGAFDELSQIPVGRDCELLDWVADLVGLLIGALAFALLSNLLRRPRRTSFPT